MEVFLNETTGDGLDLVSWVFGNQSYDQDRVIYVDADQPERSITAKQARQRVRQLIAGFRAGGLRKGDCICIHAFNDVGCSSGKEMSLLREDDFLALSGLLSAEQRLI